MELRSFKLVIAGFLVFFSALYGIQMAIVMPILSEIMDQYQVGRGEVSLLTSGVFLIHGLMIIPGSMIVARLKIKTAYAVGCFLSGAMVLTVFADSFILLMILRVLYSLAFIFMMPASGKMSMLWFSQKERPIVNSLLVTTFTVGIAVGTFLGAPLSEELGWQAAVSVFGASVCIGGILWLIIIKPPSEEEKPSNVAGFANLIKALRSKVTIILGLADGFALAQYAVLTTWLPTYYNEVMGMSAVKSGFLVGLIPLAGAISAIGGGLIASRYLSRKPFFILPGLLITAAGFGTFLFNYDVIIYISIAVLGMCSFLYLPAFLTYPMEIKNSTENDVALVWAGTFAIGSLLAVVSPTSVGYVTDITGSYLPGFSFWAIIASGLLICGLILPEPGKTTLDLRKLN